MTHDNNSSAMPVQRQLVIFTSDCLIGHMHLNDIMPFLKEQGIKPVVFMLPDTKSPKAQIPSLQRFSFYEEGILNDVIYPALDVYESRTKRLTPTFNQLSRDYGFKAVAVEKQTDPAIMAALEAPGTIGALSVYHDVIFKAPLIEAVKKKGFFWNLHPAVLPQNQGLYLAFWNMVHGKGQHGCTLHEIDEGIDTGRIIATSHGRLNYSKPVISQYFDFVKGGSALIKKALLQQLRLGSVSYKPVDPHAETQYRSFPTEDDIAAGERAGVRLVGTPEEMVNIYTAIFGNRDMLRSRILNAIFEYEEKYQEQAAPVTLPAAAIAQRENNKRRAAALGLS